MRTHQVPEDLRKETARTMRSTLGLIGRPSDAERSRTLLSASTFGALATQSVECPGYPFGSLVAYAVDDNGCPLMALSGLAEHSRNVAADPRGSLMVTNPEESPDPLALSRVTLIGEVATLAGEERAAAIDTYRRAHPEAYYITFSDFELYRLQVSSLRYVGGFGRMSWVTAEKYRDARPDPLLPHAARILEHMNADHADALVAYCKIFGGIPETREAELAAVDRYGMDLLARSEGSPDRRAVRVPFPAPADTVDAVRLATMELFREARVRLDGAEG